MRTTGLRISGDESGDELWRALANNIPDFIMLIDAQGTICDINRVLPGYRRDDVLGASIFSFLPPEQHSVAREAVHQAFFTGEVASYCTTGSGRPGELRYYESRVCPVRQGSQLRQALLIASDVTERERTRMQAQRTAATYRAVIEASPDAMLVLNREGRIVDANTHAANLLTTSAGVLHGYNVLELIESGVSSASFVERIQRVVAGESLDFEVQMRRACGELFPAEIRIRAQGRDELGASYVVAFIRDLTERKQVDHLLTTLARSNGNVPLEEFLTDQIRQLARVYKCRYAFVGRLVEPGQRRISMLAMTVDGVAAPVFDYDLYGTPCQEILDLKVELIPRDAWKLYPDDALLGEMGIESYFGAPLISSDGRTLGLVSVMNTEPLDVPQRIRPVLSVFATRLANEIERSDAIRALRESHDFLERRVAERTANLQAVNRELESFTYSVSHDLRAPLRAIDGFSRALEQDNSRHLDEAGLGYLQRVRAATRRMSDLIDALLRISRVSRVEIRRERVNMSAMAQEVIASFPAHRSGAPVDVRIAPNMVVVADAALVRVVVENLLSNAWKYTAQTRSVRIEMRNVGDGAAFVVEDNGAGFDMKHAGNLFGAFQRLHPQSEYEGAGIGLATVQRIVTRHGGAIWAEAEVGRGARFYFTFGPESQE